MDTADLVLLSAQMAATWAMVGLIWFLQVVGLVVLVVVHLSTVLLQVPAHDRLSDGYDRDVVRRLVRTNRVRTVGWSTRGVLSVVMLVVVAA